MSIEEVVERLRIACAESGSQVAWARQHGIAPSYVSDVIQGRREPAGKLLDALGIERVVTYRKRPEGLT